MNNLLKSILSYKPKNNNKVLQNNNNNINNNNNNNNNNNYNINDNNENNTKNKTTKIFTIVDFPQKGTNTGSFTGITSTIAANKVFNRLIKELNYNDNENGRKYLVFYIMDINTKKIEAFIGTIVILDHPIEIDRKNKTIKITHRNIVTKYTLDMKDIFVRE
jgi:hypothetical protein